MARTYLLDFDTIATDPRFFSMLALVERTAGSRIVVLDGDPKRKSGEKTAAMEYGVSLHRYIQWNGEPVDDSVNPELHPDAARHRAKTHVAKSLRDKAPVIWIDLDFGDWRGAPV